MAPIRIALFLCDHTPPPVRATDGDYLNVFRTLLRDSSPSTEFDLVPFEVRERLQYPEPEEIDGFQAILLTGSAASAYENVEWINKLVAYIASIAEEKPHIKLLGICFGHQIISRALGSDCVPNNGKWEVGVTPVTLTETGKQLFGANDLNIQQMHQDHVPDVPRSCLLLASTSVTPNQGYIRLPPSIPPPDTFTPDLIKDIQIFTVQGHPEFTKRIVGHLIDLREGSGLITKPVAEDARRREDWRNDGVDVIGKVIWKVLGVGLDLGEERVDLVEPVHA